MVKEGMPFRDAYNKIGEAIATGNYTPKKDISHTHVGSLSDSSIGFNPSEDGSRPQKIITLCE